MCQRLIVFDTMVMERRDKCFPNEYFEVQTISFEDIIALMIFSFFSSDRSHLAYPTITHNYVFMVLRTKNEMHLIGESLLL